MNPLRLRPPKDCADLEVWLCGVVNDAIRDATEAGLPEAHALQIVRKLADMRDPLHVTQLVPKRRY